MSLEKAHTAVKKMTFGENRDLERVVTAPVSSGKSNVLTSILTKKNTPGLRLHVPKRYIDHRCGEPACR